MDAVTDVKIIDTDSHVVEPADLWTSRISTQKWGDKVLHVKWDERKKVDFWYIGDRPVFSAWGTANWGWRGGNISIVPRFEDMHRGTWDLPARLKEMDASGVRAA